MRYSTLSTVAYSYRLMRYDLIRGRQPKTCKLLEQSVHEIGEGFLSDSKLLLCKSKSHKKIYVLTASACLYTYDPQLSTASHDLCGWRRNLVSDSLNRNDQGGALRVLVSNF